jgi:hypothetical protein
MSRKRKESWRPVVGYEGVYEVSSCGRVRRLNTDPRYQPYRLLRPDRVWTGYLRVTLSKNNKQRRYYVHRLVLGAFIGPSPEDAVACHNDGDRANNHLLNLRWDTRCANEADKAAHGTKLVGESTPWAKLTAEAVTAARARYAGGETSTALAREYGVAQVTIMRAIKGRTWAHV